MKRLQLALLLMVSPILLCAADPVVGTWHLSLAKSKYLPGPPPRSQTRVYFEEKGSVKAVVVTVYQNGETDTILYPSAYDGKAHPISGAADRDGILMVRVNEYVAESVITHAGMKIAEARRTVSLDGKTMTITYEGILNGETVKNIAFYEKEPN
jgi:hypothetical protein